MIYPLKLYVKHLPNSLLIGLSLLANAVMWVWLGWQIPHQSDPIFLHYNILFGVDYIGEWWRAFALPLTGLVVLLVNTVLGWWLFSRDKFLNYLLLGIALMCQILLLLGSALLVFLNV